MFSNSNQLQRDLTEVLKEYQIAEKEDPARAREIAESNGARFKSLIDLRREFLDGFKRVLEEKRAEANQKPAE